MARPVWKGSISFGLVNVPVALYRATESRDVSFHQLERGTGERIRYQRVAEGSGREVGYDDIVKGYEVAPGEHVVVEPDELEAVEPGPSHTIEIEELIELDQVDPVYFERSYYLAPIEGSGAEKAYVLLRAAMEGAGRAAIGRLVLRAKQHLVAIRARGDVLVLETMFFPDEVRDPVDELPTLPEQAQPSARELQVAGQLLDSLTVAWDPDRYRDTYRDRVLELIERKAAGEHVVSRRPAGEPAQVVDLMAALEASLAVARGGGGSGGAKDRGEVEGSGEGRASASADYSSWSKAGLYEEAQRRELPGRSRMTRDELAAALGEASLQRAS